LPCWLGVGCEKTLHQALDFLSRDQHIPKELPESPASEIAEPWRNRHDRTPHADDPSQLGDELAITVRLGTDGIDDAVRAFRSLRDCQVSQVVHVDWLQAIVTGAEDPEYGEAAEDPGNVVDQDALAAEEHGRS
jgi:hypothetical protein